ncbi:protein C3orf33-like [Anneissia japonica]|uniref:protein C3orf33-like n=1 Tax=Anneissia japonica TaxID=1529436 RepID=UPI0014255A02|nr:protein C3orf33-like [Anneissia japonica]
MDEDSDGNDLLNKVSRFIDKNIRNINNAISLCGGIGLCFILYSIRIHKRFTCFSQIPDEFIQKHFKLRGQVRSVHDDHLLVEHKPIISIKRSTVPKPLKLHLAGVEYTREGAQFLEEHSLNKQVWFRLIQVKGQDGIDCIISLRKSMFKIWNLNEEILFHGYGKVVPVIDRTGNKFTIKLTQRLLQAELYAERKKKGMWVQPSRRERFTNWFHNQPLYRIISFIRKATSRKV